MLVDIDYKKKVVKPQLYICKPDKTVIAKLPEAFNIVYKPRLGTLNELSFSIPYEVIEDHQFVFNSNIPKLKDRFLIKYKKGNTS